nr:hypothetical protein [Tanacetum cinerariifolium]
YLERESSTKRQRMSEKGIDTMGESSLKTTEGSYQTKSSTQEHQEEFDTWSEDQGTNDDKVDAFLKNCMNNNIFHVHPTPSASSSILDLQQQLYLKMKDDEKAPHADFPLWLALTYKFKKPPYHVEPCRVDAFH